MKTVRSIHQVHTSPYVKSFAFSSSRRFGPVKNGWKNITEFRRRRIRRQARRGQLLLIPHAPSRPPPPLDGKTFFLSSFRPRPTTTVKNIMFRPQGDGVAFTSNKHFTGFFFLLRLYTTRFLCEFLFSPQNHFKTNTTHNQSQNTLLTFSHNHRISSNNFPFAKKRSAPNSQQVHVHTVSGARS